MNLRGLRYLVAIADHRHFGRAAEACFVSQPTLSTQLRKLEERLGVQLVERTNRRVMMTGAGGHVAERARRILRDVDELVREARSLGDPLGGELRVGVIPTLGPYLLPALVPALRRELPRLRPLLYEDQTERVLARLRRGDLDAAVLAVPVDDEGLATELVFREPFYLATPAGHPLAARRRARTADLAQMTVLLLEEGHCLRDQALDVCHAAGATEAPEFRATSLETLRQMVAAGAGVTLLPALAARANDSVPNGEDVEIRAFGSPPHRDVAVLSRNRAARGEAVRALARCIRAIAAEAGLSCPGDDGTRQARRTPGRRG